MLSSLPTSASTSRIESTAPPASAPRSSSAARSMSAAEKAPRRERSQSVRRASRVASAGPQKPPRETRWMVTRSSVAWTTSRASSARVSASRSNASSRDHRPTYIDGAYWAWIPHSASSACGSGAGERSSRHWRASSARLSSAAVIAGMVTDRRATRVPTAGPCRPSAPGARLHP